MYNLACLGLCMLSWWMPRGTGWDCLSQAKADSEKPFSCPFLHSSGIGLNQLSLKPWGTGFRVITEGRCRCCSALEHTQLFSFFLSFESSSSHKSWKSQKVNLQMKQLEHCGFIWLRVFFFGLVFWLFFILFFSFGWKEGMERLETSYLICTMKFPVLPLDFLSNYF